MSQRRFKVGSRGLTYRPASSAPAEWADDGEPDPSDESIWQAMFEQAADLLDLARQLSVQILMIQPMDNFGGWPMGSARGEWAKRKAERWLRLCSCLHVDQLQVSWKIAPYPLDRGSCTLLGWIQLSRRRERHRQADRCRPEMARTTRRRPRTPDQDRLRAAALLSSNIVLGVWVETGPACGTPPILCPPPY